MEVADAFDYTRDAIFVLFSVAAPIMGVGLVVGLAVAIFQSLTQIQEMTLTFVPKILSVFLSLLVLAPYILNQLSGLLHRSAERIVGLQ